MSGSMYIQLASLLTYPEADYHDKLRAAIAVAPPASVPGLAEFVAAALPMSLEELQERFTAAFDLNPKGTLDLGWHLFGEKYERGLLLVRMRQQLAKYGIAESTELPDHLTHALRLLAAMQSEPKERTGIGCSDAERPEEDPAADFLGAIVLPALPAILSAAEESAPYDLLLKAIDSLLRAQFPGLEAGPQPNPLPIIEKSRAYTAAVCAGTTGDER